MGSDLHLDAFLPIVERYRNLWFPTRKQLMSTCDPAGANENSQGMRGTPVAMLQDWYAANGERDEAGKFVSPMYIPNANQPEMRLAANQRAATYMRRMVNGEEAFLVDPERWALVELQDEKYDRFFLDGLEAGYVLEDESRHSGKLGSFFVPKKDGWFEHPMNCFEYGIQSFVLDLPMSDEKSELAKVKHRQVQEREAQRLLRKSQDDRDPSEIRIGTRIARNGMRMGRRGGY